MYLPNLHTKAVIFDLDGTLLDTAPDLIAACNATLVHFGYDEIPEELARTRITAGMRELLKLGLPFNLHDDNNPQLLTMRDYFAHYYIEHICDYTEPYLGIEQLLDDLVAADIKIAVVTNKYHNMAQKLLRKFPFYSNLSLILGCDSVKHCKPHPEPILKTLDALKVQAYEAVYVGDHRNDIMAANRARTHSAVAMWGYGPLECGDPRNWHPHFILDNVEDLGRLVLPGYCAVNTDDNTILTQPSPLNPLNLHAHIHHDIPDQERNEPSFTLNNQHRVVSSEINVAHTHIAYAI